MTPRLRTPYALAVASLVLTGPVAYAEEPGPPAAGPSAKPGARASLAGRQAGEGRARPGRPAASPPEGLNPSTGVGPVPSPFPARTAPSASPPSRSPSQERTSRPGERETAAAEDLPGDPDDRPDLSHVPGTPPPAAARRPEAQALTEPAPRPVSVLTLGAGITLIGLGLGFLGVQIRRR